MPSIIFPPFRDSFDSSLNGPLIMLYSYDACTVNDRIWLSLQFFAQELSKIPVLWWEKMKVKALKKSDKFLPKINKNYKC